MEVKCIMKLIRSCIVSFSMYSKIPMPQFKWNDDDMKYMLVFFPWIGAVIGLLLMLWKYIYSHFGVADICYVCIGALIPMAISHRWFYGYNGCVSFIQTAGGKACNT